MKKKKTMINVTKKICKNWSEREGYKPDVIVIHISAGSLTSMTNWFSTPGSQASSHYGIGRDGTVLQYVEEDKKAWTQGRVNNPSSKIVKSRPGVNPNLYCLSIENEGQDLSLGTIVQIRTLLELIKELSTKWNIPLDRDHIIGHYEIDAVNRPHCPSPNHNLLDSLVKKLGQSEMVSILVPRSKVEVIKEFIKSLT